MSLRLRLFEPPKLLSLDADGPRDLPAWTLGARRERSAEEVSLGRGRLPWARGEVSSPLLPGVWMPEALREPGGGPLGVVVNDWGSLSQDETVLKRGCPLSAGGRKSLFGSAGILGPRCCCCWYPLGTPAGVVD